MNDAVEFTGHEASRTDDASSLQEILCSTLSNEKLGADYSVTIVKDDHKIVRVINGESVVRNEDPFPSEKGQESKPRLSFDSLSRNWLDTCLGFMDAFPLYRAIAEIHQAQKVENNIEKYLKRVAESEPKSTKDANLNLDIYTVDKSYSYEISRRIASLNRTKRAKATISRGQLLVAIAEYEAFFCDLLRLIIGRNPEAFIPSDAKISAQDVLRGVDIQGLKESIIESKINSIQRDSHVSQINYLYKVLKITPPDTATLKTFGEICERRNLIIHGNGVVNKIYRDNLKDLGYSENDIPKIGESIITDNKYLIKAISTIFTLFMFTLHIIWQKIDPQASRASVEELISAAHDLLILNLTKMSGKLSEFTLAKASPADERQRAYSIINLALSVRLNRRIPNDEKLKKIDEILKMRNWDIVSPRFKLAIACLRQDYSDLGRLIDAAVDDEVNQVNFLTWALFSEARDQPVFKEKMLEHFGVKMEEGSLEEEIENDEIV